MRYDRVRHAVQLFRRIKQTGFSCVRTVSHAGGRNYFRRRAAPARTATQHQQFLTPPSPTAHTCDMAPHVAQFGSCGCALSHCEISPCDAPGPLHNSSTQSRSALSLRGCTPPRNQPGWQTDLHSTGRAHTRERSGPGSCTASCGRRRLIEHVEGGFRDAVGARELYPVEGAREPGLVAHARARWGHT